MHRHEQRRNGMYDAQLDGHAYFEDAPASRTAFEDAAAAPAGHSAAGVLQTALLASVLDEIDYGLMVLGADAQILFANQLARLELGGERFVRRRQDRLAASAARHGANIDTALANIRRGQRSLLTLSGTDGELALSFVPLNPGAQPAAQTPDAPLALVIFGKRDACEALTLHQYGHLHGLTPAEQALMPAISRGLGAEAIAQQQCVAVTTVRTQLGSIRGKTGASSLRALMARLTTLPPIRPVFKAAQAH
jgi:DNA-binding CsgD family transcriptional regulator